MCIFFENFYSIFYCELVCSKCFECIVKVKPNKLEWVTRQQNIQARTIELSEQKWGCRRGCSLNVKGEELTDFAVGSRLRTIFLIPSWISYDCLSTAPTLGFYNSCILFNALFILTHFTHTHIDTESLHWMLLRTQLNAHIYL